MKVDVFDISELMPNLNIHPVGHISLDALTQNMRPPATVAMAEPARAEAAPVAQPHIPEIEGLSSSICRDWRGRYAICQDDGVHERWERYRPQQPSFRSRFINR